MSVVELLRQYSLREYTAIVAVAVLGGVGVVFLLNTAGAGSASGDTIALKREDPRAAPSQSVHAVESAAIAAERRAKERAKVLAERRRVRAIRAARAERREAAAAARSRASRRTVVRSTPRPAASAPTRVVNRTPAPAPKPQPAPVSSPSPKKSGSNGGGGGSFDDSG